MSDGADTCEVLNAALAGRYELGEELGAGGMATVYLAQDVRHGRPVAVKVLRPELAEFLGADRFLAEIEVTANLMHPHILTLHDSGEVQGLLYYVMPYVEGESLRQRLERERELPVNEALAITQKVGSALDYAHRQGVVHRDIKPANILLQDGQPLIADFGIALALSAAAGERLTETGLSIGTPQYMSPEQAAGDRPIDARSDLYSLACILYEMLAGEPPFRGGSAQSLLARKLTETAPDVSVVRETVPRPMAHALRRAMARTPADRYATLADFVRALGAPPNLNAVGRGQDSGAGAGDRTGQPDDASASTRSARPAVPPWLGYAAVGVVVLGIGWGLTSRARNATETVVSPPPESSVIAPDPANASSPPSVAILPFTDMSAAGDQVYFGDGLAEEILTKLLAAPQLRVASRTASFSYRESAQPPSEIGRELNVIAVLEGSVRTEGDSVRITAQLVSVETGFSLWGETFDRRMESVFAVQDEIAASIAETLEVELTGRAAQATQATTVDAYDAYLRARRLIALRSPEGLMEAELLLEGVLAQDPDYTPARAALAFAMALGFQYTPSTDSPEARRRVLDEASRALAQDSAAVEAATAQALVEIWTNFGWESALATLTAAISRAPNHALLHHARATVLLALGRFPEAAQEWRTTVQLEPSAPIYLTNEAWVDVYCDNVEAAVRRADLLRESHPAFFGADFLTGLASIRAGDFEAAVAAMSSPLNDHMASYLGYALARRGDLESATDLLQDFDARRSYHAGALVAAGLGDVEGTLDRLERAFEVRSGHLSEVAVRPEFQFLRGEARFGALLRAMGLEDVSPRCPGR